MCCGIDAIGYLRSRYFPFRLATSIFFAHVLATTVIVQGGYRAPFEIILTMLIAIMFVDLFMVYYVPRYIYRLMKFCVFMVVYRDNIWKTWALVHNHDREERDAKLIVERTCDVMERRLKDLRYGKSKKNHGARVSKKEVRSAGKKFQ